MGDVGRGLFVRPGIPDFMRDHAIPAADVITPNQFELDILAGTTTAMLADAKVAVGRVHAMGPRVILVTSLQTEETPADAVDMLASDGTGLWRVRTPRLAIKANGAGDAIAALFNLHWMRTGSAPEALAKAAASVYGLLRRTAEAGALEILTVEAQDEFVTPSRTFDVEPL